MTSEVKKTSNPDINGLLWGWKWDQTHLTYSFPAGTAEYIPNPSPSTPGDQLQQYVAINGFQAFTPAQQTAVRTVLANVSSFCNLSFTETTSAGADLRYANARTVNYSNDITVINPALSVLGLHTPGRTDTLDTATNSGTAEANPPQLYYNDGTPPTSAPFAQGDAWFTVNRYTNPTLGSFQYSAGVMHETGHNLGLKHGHVSQLAHGDYFSPLPADHDSYEYSVMTYSTFPGDNPGDGDNARNHPTTFMQDDIAALQYMYGANYNYNSGDTTYSWSPTTGQMFVNGSAASGTPAQNYVLMTLWDGGGTDTYDFSNYTTKLWVDLNPGDWTILDTSTAQLQRADLGNAGGGAEYFARGNIANAQVDPHNPNETASLIENAIGGSGNDVILGNAVDNVLNGGLGNDTFNGRGGRDTLIGGIGDDYYLLQDVSLIYVGWELIGEDYDTVVEYLDGGNADWVQVGHVRGALFDHSSYTLPDAVENVLVDGFDAFNVTGNAYWNTMIGNGAANTLVGLGGSDTLNGGGGLDTLIGGIGDDTYVLSDVSFVYAGWDLIGEDYDTVVEAAGEGTDWVQVGHVAGSLFDHTSYTLPDNVENSRVDGADAFNLRGNELANQLIGNDAANTLRGAGGDDTLDGGESSDTAIFSGRKAEYRFSGTLDNLTVADTVNARDGTDTVQHVELLQFADGLFAVDVAFNTPPQLTVADRTSKLRELHPLADWVKATDADGDAITQYRIIDNGAGASSGYFWMNNARQPANAVITVNAAELGNLLYRGGQTAGSETLSVQAFDGKEWSEWKTFTVTSRVNSAPVVAAKEQTVAKNASFAASSLFSVSDADGDAITAYRFRDATAGNSSGHFVVNGVTQGANQTINVSAAQLSQTTFQTGTTADNLWVQAYDGQAWSSWTQFQLIPQVNRAPVVTAADLSVEEKTSLAASSLFSVGDADGDAITAYRFRDATADAASGHFVINGVAQGVNKTINVSAAQLSQTMFQTGSTADNLWVQAFDGQAWSAWKSFTVTAVHPIVGTEGDDVLVGDASDNIIRGLGGQDELIGKAGRDVLDGGAGVDTANYSASSSGVAINLANGTGHGGDAEGDTLISIEHATGSAFNDTFQGGTDRGQFIAGDGNDTMIGGSQYDWFEGGTGNDTFTGTGGFMVMLGGDGDDHMTGSLDSANYFDGGTGNDVMTGGNTTDYMADVIAGDDAMRGGGGDDTMVDLYGATQLYGEDGNDFVTSAGGSGLLDGGAGNDYVTVANGNYTLLGGGGDDTFEFAGFGNTTYTGGDGADVFTYRVLNGAGGYTVTDFEDGSDRIYLWDNHYYGNVPFESLTIADSANGAVISWNGWSEMVLTGIHANQLTQSDFFV